MARIVIRQDLVTDPDTLVRLCPFGAIDYANEYLGIGDGCRMCMLCVKKGPSGVFRLEEDEQSAGALPDQDRTAWCGIAVYADQIEGAIHPVTFELLGKARELAEKVGHPIHALLAGYGIRDQAVELLRYGADEVLLYDHQELQHFRIEPYAAVFEDFVRRIRPSVVLVGGTSVGRSLAPRVAARFRTGLTADCTLLDIQPDTDLDQIRPAFGGNIMAHIRTPKRRPQFATVRYRIFGTPPRRETPAGRIVECGIPPERLASGIRVLEIRPKEKEKGIEEAEVLVVAGRGIRKREDLVMIEELAEHLGGQTAATRHLIESGWADPRRQIGLSGRTVRPKLIVTCGVSGAIQFTAGMRSAETIIAINEDPKAPIFDVAHYALVGDIYEIVPELVRRIRTGGAAAAERIAPAASTGDRR